MAVIKLREFQTAWAVEMHLQGGVPVNPREGALISGVVGKTLIFSKPVAATCTFVAGTNQIDPTALSIQEIKAQLEAAIAGLKMKNHDKQFFLVESSPTFGNGVTITGGTAREFFGFSGILSGVVYQASGGAPQWLSSYGGMNSHVLVTLE